MQPDVEIVKAPYLNDHPRVLDAFVDRVGECRTADNVMNCRVCKYGVQMVGYEGDVGTPQAGHHLHVRGIGVEKDVYPVGRLDKDSEGLLILTNDTSLNANLLSPSQKHKRSYFVQVDFDLTADAIEKLKKGVNISIDSGKYTTKPCSVKKLPKPPVLPQRNPPIRVRQNIPTSWALIELEEGKNRQVRKMFSSVGFPVLRLVRIQIEDLKIGKLEPGKYTEIGQEELFRLLKIDHSPKKSGIVLNTGSSKSQNNVWISVSG